MHYPRIKYEFINNVTGDIYELKDDPTGWSESERVIKRSAKNLSLYREFSKNLGFTGEAARKLTEYYLTYDIEADITLRELRMEPNTTTENYYIHTSGELDFSEWSKKDNIVSVPFRSGGLEKIIASQINEKFDIQRIDSLDGEIISDLELNKVLLTSREILLISTLENEEVASPENILDRNMFQTIVSVFNLKVISNSDQEHISYTGGQFAGVYELNGGAIIPVNSIISADKFFYLNSLIAKTLNVRCVFDIIASQPSYEDPLTSTRHELYIWKYRYDEASTNFIYIDRYPVAVTGYGGDRVNGDVTINNIDIQVGDSLMLGYLVETINNGINRFYCSRNEIELTITEDSVTPETTTDSIFVHEAFNRLLEIYTGKNNLFYSEAYGQQAFGYNQDGEFSFNAVTLGFWIRQFFDKKMQLSMNNALKSVDALTTSVYSIYKVNGVEKMVLEPLKFFFQDDFVIDLGVVSDVEEMVANEFYYRGTKFGYKKPDGDRLYEEAMGLDEHNVLNSWTLPITRSEDTYEKISEWRMDGYGKAFASRKPKVNYPEEDTQYDQEIFYLDLKAGLGLAYIETSWQDYYEIQPTGIYSPDTATGLNFTPFRMQERHEYFFGSGLRNSVFQQKYIRFASSNGNSLLSTKKANKPLRQESGSKIINEITRSNIYPKWYKFTKKVDFAISQKLDGFKNVNGREIPNVFFKVKFRHENKDKFGYIFEVKPDGEGKWKLLKAL